jgi:hypothetical protein
VKALRAAFNETMKDKELLTEVKKAQLDFEPATGEELAKIIAETLSVDQETIDRMRKITTAE